MNTSESREAPPRAMDVIVSVSAFFVGSFVLFALVTLIAGLPIPRVHDEFSYLLAADTFARGRMTNPTHPLWPHFETFHVIHTPSYQSKYPPGQGLALALGRLAGHPIVGVWLSGAAALAALFWCLARWLPMRWAVAGAALTLLHPLILRWSQCYWGGAMALLGGSLLMGSLRGRSRWNLLIAAAGILILANSRPYEGLMLCVVAAPLLWRLPGKIVAGIVLAAGLAGMGMYNRAVTGSFLKMPYFVHEQQYAVVPLYVFQPLRAAPQDRHERLRQFYAEWAVAEYRETSLAERLTRLARGAFRLSLPAMDGERFGQEFPPIYLSVLFIIPIAGMFVALSGDRWILYALLMLLGFTATLLPLTWLLPHYAAAAAPLLVIVLTAGLRKAQRIRFLVPLFVLAIIVSAAVSVWILREGQRGAGVWTEAVQRSHIQRELSESGENHLVIVHYPPRSFLHFEWVNNDADIDASPVVWAREMEDNAALVEYFSKREIWLLDVSVAPPRLIRGQ